MIQIEHKDAVENIDEILEVEGIDGTFIGPYDMSMSMGIPGQLDHPRIAEAMDTVLKATRAKGLIAGIHLVHPDTAVTQVADRLKEGYQFIALGTDILFLGDACRDLHDRVRRTIDGGA